MAIEAVLFDCDGVVVDSADLQVQAEQQTALTFAEEHGFDYDPTAFDWSIMQGLARKQMAARLYNISPESDEANAFRLAVVATTVRIASPENLQPIPGVASFADYLVLRGIRLGLATNSNRAIYSRYRQVNSMDFFPPQFIVAQGECRDDKPLPGQYIELMHRMGVAPKHTLVIEDSKSGITAGRFAGACVLALATTKSPKYLRSQTDAQLVASSFLDATRQLQPFLP